MYFSLILRVWVLDSLNYFLLSAILGSIIASSLKNYLSKKKSMERLKNSIIKKSRLVISPNKHAFSLKKARIKKVYKFALESRGGQSEHELSNELFKLAQEIKGAVEKLAGFLKE